MAAVAEKVELPDREKNLLLPELGIPLLHKVQSLKT
jgi:hypothetical protein